MHPDTGKSKFKAMKGYIPSSELPAFEVLDTFISHQKNLLEILSLPEIINSIRLRFLSQLRNF
jgi:hypothetical protein